MNPSKKYMPNNRNITDEDDMKLVPFNTGRQAPSTAQAPFDMSTTGWIPVYFFKNGPFNNMGTGMGGPITNSIPISGSTSLPTLPSMGMGTTGGTIGTKGGTTSDSTPQTFFPFTPGTSSITPSNRELPNIIQLLSDFDLDLDEDVDLARNCSDKSIDKIYEKIEKKHPEIFALVKAYDIPCPIFKLLIRRVIKISMNYCKREGE